MDGDEKYRGYIHIALTVRSLDDAREFTKQKGIQITGSFSFGRMSAIFNRDPDHNVIGLEVH